MIRKFILAALLLCAPSVWAQGTISAMTAASALSGTELFECVQSGSKKCTATQIKTFTSASPTLVTPNLGTPSAGVATNLSGTAASLTAGAATALAANGTNCSAGSYPLGVDASGNAESCTVAGTGTVTATGGALTANAVVLGAGTTDTKVVAGVTTDGTSALNLGVAGASVGKVVFSNATSGTGTLQPPTGALGTITYTLPGVTSTLATLGANTFTALQTITQASANAGILTSTGYSLTGSDATGMVNLAGTWNTSGTPSALKVNITNTASNANSKLIDVQASGTSKFNVTIAGTVAVPGAAGALNVSSNSAYMDANGVRTKSAGHLGFAANSDGTGTPDTLLTRSAAATLQQGAANAASPVAQTLQAQGSRSGTDTNVGGANYTHASGNGTGTGTLSQFIISTPVAVASGTGAQTITPTLTLGNGVFTIGSNVVTPASSGTRYLCISTAGVVTSSASACSGT